MVVLLGPSVAGMQMLMRRLQCRGWLSIDQINCFYEIDHKYLWLFRRAVRPARLSVAAAWFTPLSKGADSRVSASGGILASQADLPALVRP